jgi:hypothetical protein
MQTSGYRQADKHLERQTYKHLDRWTCTHLDVDLRTSGHRHAHKHLGTGRSADIWTQSDPQTSGHWPTNILTQGGPWTPWQTDPPTFGQTGPHAFGRRQAHDVWTQADLQTSGHRQTHKPLDTYPLCVHFTQELASSCAVNLLFSGGCDQDNPSRDAEDAMSQNKNCGHQYTPLWSHSSHTQQRVYVIPV